jgi:prepilin-type N-terminal cleavage/methylation domain-containing protein
MDLQLLYGGHGMGKRAFGQESGFTMVELIMAITIGLIVVGMALGGAQGLVKTSRADGGLAQAASGLRAAREMSVSARRNVRISFGTNQIMNTRVEYCAPTPCTPATTLVRTTTLEGRAEFRLETGLPDTPDGFGMASATAFGSLTPPMFTTDGSFINSNGDVLNGTLFIGVGNDTLSARAITIFGATGAMRLWRWDGMKWVEV